eukprot:6204195-Pleurochrysis_carterae.AAC.3
MAPMAPLALSLFPVAVCCLQPQQAAPMRLRQPPVRCSQPTAMFGRGSSQKLPQVVEECALSFKKTPEAGAVEALWRELRRCYADEDLAIQAITQNPQIINPVYTNPPSIISRSKSMLLEKMDEDRAIRIMLKNPAVLQCGSTLKNQSAEEIEAFANVCRRLIVTSGRFAWSRMLLWPNMTVRQVLDSVPSQVSSAAIILVLLAILTSILGSRMPDAEGLQQVLQVLRPLLGSIFASCFLATVASALRTQLKMRDAQNEVLRSRNFR